MLGVIGDIVQDVVVRPSGAVRHATDTESHIAVGRGGSAANVAAFAGPRHPTRFLGCVGRDITAAALRQELESHHVEVTFHTAEVPTGTIVVMIDADGERTMFPSRAAAGHIGPVAESWLAGLDILHVTGYSLANEPARTSVIDAVRRARARGTRISLDVSSAGMIDALGVDTFRTLMREMSPDLVSANADEAALLALADAGGPGRFLPELGATTLLARAGAEATRIFVGGELAHTIDVTPAERVVDATGAGDAFNAGLLTATLQGRNIADACRAANDLAQLVLAHPGASDGS